MNRKDKCELVLTHVCNYLKDAGWNNPPKNPFQWEDPEEGLVHRTDFAFCIQSSRDLRRGSGLTEL